MYFAIGLIIFVILSFRVSKYNKRAYKEFFAESAPDKKETEIGFFWKRIKAASTKPMKEEVIITQSLYWCFHQKALKRRYIAFAILIIGVLVEWLMY